MDRKRKLMDLPVNNENKAEEVNYENSENQLSFSDENVYSGNEEELQEEKEIRPTNQKGTDLMLSLCIDIYVDGLC